MVFEAGFNLICIPRRVPSSITAFTPRKVNTLDFGISASVAAFTDWLSTLLFDRTGALCSFAAFDLDVLNGDVILKHEKLCINVKIKNDLV